MPGGWTEPAFVRTEIYANPVYGQATYGEGTYGGIWTDLSTDVRSTDGIQISYGINGNGPMDRLAGPGSLKFVLDNSQSNSNGQIGYYTPDHAGVRSGWFLGVKVRVSIAYGSLYGQPLYGAEVYGEQYFEFVGWVKRINPTLDVYGDRVVQVEAGDWMDRASLIKVERIPVSLLRRSDLLIGDVLGPLTVKPESQVLNTGQETFTSALDDLRDERTAVTEALYRIVLSEFGYAYIRNAPWPGGRFVFENRHLRVKDSTSLWSPVEGEFFEGSAEQGSELVFNIIRATAYPRSTGGGVEVLASLQASAAAIQIRPGETQKITLRYRDPSALGTRVSGQSMVTPVAATDYNFSSSTTDSGDLNSKVTVAVSFGANEAEYTCANIGILTCNVTKLQARGTAVRIYDPVVIIRESAASQALHGERPVDLNLPYQDKPLRAQDYGEATLQKYKSPLYSRSITFWLNGDNTRFTKGLKLGPGDRITLAESASALSGDWVISGVQVEIIDNNKIRKTWVVVPANLTAYWLIGTAGYSELGVTTIVGF